MSSLAWYWHRLRAMSSAELASHGRRKVHQISDRYLAPRRFSQSLDLGKASTFPQLPRPEQAPEALKAALQRETEEILRGEWIAFGYLKLQVEDPPRWHKDYFAGVDMATTKPALKLHHRLEGKADIKFIWEPSRWYSLVRLAQAAYILKNEKAADACIRWLEDWAETNPPYFGWNWVSALETGIRLIQLAWIDALLRPALGESRNNPGSASGNDLLRSRLAKVCGRLLPSHLWYTWRDRSFGSSANNHLIGELSGLIAAVARWPESARWAVPLQTLQRCWEREVLTQFASDGGNREQALNYHLFSWEFCWQARLALLAAGRTVSPEVEERLRAAAAYFVAIQMKDEQWDYGDSDSAFVTPFFLQWPKAASEWLQWFQDPADSPSIRYWLGEPPKPLRSSGVVTLAGHWHVYPESGFAVYRSGDWFLRWDLSPLGYLATAGHGHCDALHLSIWYKGQALVIDPGTGAYHADRPLRDYLASWEAHNGPHPTDLNFPERRGAFLWSGHHQLPRWKAEADGGLTAELALPTGIMRRKVQKLETGNGWRVEDSFDPDGSAAALDLLVMWQLAPGTRIEPKGARDLDVVLRAGTVTVEPGAAWTKIEHWSPGREGGGLNNPQDLRGHCSQAFRKVEDAPCVLLRKSAAAGTIGNGGALQTIFRVSA